MPAIGYVTRDGEGFKGQLKTLSIRTEIEILPNRSKSADTQPDYRVSAGGVEVGAGWVRRGEMSGRLEFYQQTGNASPGSQVGSLQNFELNPGLEAIVAQFSYSFGR